MELVKQLIMNMKAYLKQYGKEMTNVQKWKWENNIKYLENKLKDMEG